MKEGKKATDRDLVPYIVVWEELAVIKGLVCRGERLVIPVLLRDWVVDLGHSAHQGVDANKRQLRVRLCFPGMDKAVKRRVSTCLPSQASVKSKARDPLKPWSRLYMDHWDRGAGCTRTTGAPPRMVATSSSSWTG